MSSNTISDPTEKSNFPHKILLSYKQVCKLPKAFANNPSANIKLSKFQLSKIVQSGGFIGRLLRPPVVTVLSLPLAGETSGMNAIIEKKVTGLNP